jgi:hypothetical protein
VLVFFSPWCESYLAKSRPRVAESCRRVREAANALAPKGGARWLGIASGLWASPADLADYPKENPTAIPATLDAEGALFRAFGVRDVPTVIVLDSAGRITRKVGPEVEDVARAVEGGPVSQSSSGSPYR